MRTALPYRALGAWAAIGLTCLLLIGRSPSAAAHGGDLPEGPGKSILQTRCTTCHALGELPKFRSYNRAEWRNLVVTMVDYGATLDEPEIDVLAEYLVEHFGTRD